MRCVGVIPVRYASTRFPGKPLADLNGHPMIYHVYQRASQAAELSRLVVATDDERIRQAVEAFGGEVVMTSSNHATGTDRVAEAVRHLEADIVVNVQGDEPLLNPAMITQVIQPLLREEAVRVTTLMHPIKDIADALDANVVKMATDLDGNVLYYSRAPIPYPKDRKGYQMDKQIGLYAFRRQALEAFASWVSTPLETAEGIELFRFLEHAWKVRAVRTTHHMVPVDTPEDLERVRRLLKSKAVGSYA